VHDDRSHRSQLHACMKNADVKSLWCGRTGVETTGQKTDTGAEQDGHDGQEAVVLVGMFRSPSPYCQELSLPWRSSY